MNTTLKKPNMVPYLVRRTGNMAKNMVANMERPALEIMGLNFEALAGQVDKI
jgi:hypothetical protein